MYGAETDMLSARDVFSSLQTPPEAMTENLGDILGAIECNEACVTFQHRAVIHFDWRAHTTGLGVLFVAGMPAPSATACS